MTNKIFLFTLFFIFALTSCSDSSDVKNPQDNNVIYVNDLREASEVLSNASNNDKVIVKITNDKETSNWTIQFSDNTFINIKNEKNNLNEITPILQIASNGYGTASYDNGESFFQITNSEGNPIKSENSKGIGIRFVVSENKLYCIERFYTSNPTEVIETIETSYTANNDNLIRTITKNQINNTVAITLSDGSEFKFSYKYECPTSITILSSEALLMEKNAIKTIDFKVVPSNAEFKYDIESNQCEISLHIVDENNKDAIKEPSNYRLKNITQVYDENQKLIEGQYKAYIEDLNQSTTYNDKVAIVLATKNENNENVQISSPAFNVAFSDNNLINFELLKINNQGKVLKDVSFTLDENNNYILSTPYVSNCSDLKPSFICNGKVYVNDVEQISGSSTIDLSTPVTYTVVPNKGENKTYTVSLRYSGLPVVEINTPNNANIVSKEDWMENTTMKIINTDGTEDYYGVINIRGRGNSTWGYPKKPYAIKLEKKAKILKMPEHKRWVLLANWLDRTMLRNNVAFKIGWSTGLAWTPRGENVEVVLNGKHIGNYFLCEDKKTGKDRIDIHELEGNKTAPEEITGGYLLELDTNYDEINKFKSQYRGFPYMFQEPDEEVLNQEMFTYLQNYINSMEETLYTPEKFTAGEFKTYIDMNSFIDYWIACELTMNLEYGHPKSTFMYKDKGEKLKAGPMWDFDYETFVPYKANSLQIGNCLYYPELFKDQEFKSIVKERWAMWKSKLEAIPEYINEQKELLRNSDKMNIEMWPVTSNVNGDANMSYEDAVNRLKEAYQTKLNFLDNYINSL